MEILGFVNLVSDCLVAIILVCMAIRNRKIAWFLLALALGIYPIFETLLRVLLDASNVKSLISFNVIGSAIKQLVLLLGVSLLYFNFKGSNNKGTDKIPLV